MVKFYYLTIASFLSATSFASIPVRWSTDAYKIKPLIYECYHGETLDLAAALTAYGEPLDFSGKTARLYWQTNGMDSAWWVTNAQVRAESGATNIIAAIWSGAYDTGVDRVTGFIGLEGENYRAAFELKFRSSPGFSPSTLPMPTKTINWSAVVNENIDHAPFELKGGRVMDDYTTTNAVKTIVNAEVGGTNAVKAAVASVEANAASWTAKQDALVSGTNIKTINGESVLGAGNIVIQGGTTIADYTTTNAVRDIAGALDVAATNALGVAIRAEIASQTPGNYATVSNRAMTAVQPSAISDMETQTHAEATYQPKGDYVALLEGIQHHTKTAATIGERFPESTVGDYSFVAGKYNIASAYASAAFGFAAKAKENYEWVWNHDENKPYGTFYEGHGYGTFNINPKDGADGFWIGETNLAGIVSGATNGLASASYVDTQNATTRAIVQTWEQFLDGSNVVFSITNYISGAYSLDEAKLRILEMTNGVYREVYNSRGEIVMHLADFETNVVSVAVADLRDEIADKADKAWGKYTSAGGEAPSNTVYMTAPNTVFAGGLEYERVAVGEGMVGVLTTHGAPAYTAGDEGTFKFQDDGGTNYFGFAKTDSYTIGCRTDGISVEQSTHIVTLEYDVTMSGVPCVWYAASLVRPVSWEQLNTPDGQPVAGASHVVSWEQNPPAGKEICYINCTEAKGFFKATIEVPGSAKFMTNMPADFSGGILCTDGQHKVKIDYNNGNPRLVVVQ